MMEEVSTMMAYDANVMEQMSEEEILACLVSETGPTFTVPSKKAKLLESRLQIMDDEGKDEDEDPVDKYLKENLRLQQTSLRLEQENDNLAHRLISSKVALRNALDTAEDRVDDLSKDLAQTRHRLKATEEVLRHKEEETSMLKEVFRRELEKAEQDLKRSSGIITDYKQICSQLTNRLEKQQSSHREKLDSIKSAVKSCSHCQHILVTTEPLTGGQSSPTSVETETQDERTRETELQEGSEAQKEEEQKEEQKEEEEGDEEEEEKREQKEKQEKNDSLRAQIRELEKELAQTKLQLVESKCKIQELEHQKGVMTNQLQETKNSWINKAFTSLRTSNGGLQALSLPRDGAPSLGWNLHGGSLSGKMLSWRQRENKVNHS